MTAAVRWVREHAPAPSTDRLIVAAIAVSVLIVGLSSAALVLAWQERTSSSRQVRTDEIAACRAAYSAELITGPITGALKALAEHGDESTEFRAAVQQADEQRFVELAELSRTDPEAFLDLCHAADNRPAPQSCDEAREHGLAPIERGDAHWTTRLDGDGDGVACE